MRVVWSSLLIVSLGLIAWGAYEAGEQPYGLAAPAGDDGSGLPPPPPPPTQAEQ